MEKNTKAGRPKGTTKERKPISSDIFEYLMSSLDRVDLSYQDRQIVVGAFLLLRYGGFRASELLSLTVKDLWDLNLDKVIHLRNNTKRKLPREVYFSTAHAERIFNHFASFMNLDDSRVKLFHGRGSRYGSRNKDSFVRKLNVILHTLLGAQYSTHSFRAGHITDLHNSDISMRVIQAHIGHTSISTTMRYVSVREEQKRAAVEMLR